jgi:hypothetical protein
LKIHHASSIRPIKNKLFTDEIKNLIAFLNALTDDIPENFKKAPQEIAVK